MYRPLIIAAVAAVLVTGCDSRTIPTAVLTGEQCLGYPPEASSPNVLPYRVGQSFFVIQGNCTNASHQGVDRYAYDFGMPIGTTLVAIRDGVVLSVDVSFPDGDRSTLAGNTLVVRHDDDTFAVYVHLAQDGALAAVGEAIRQGEPLALSGDSGRTGGAHLHLELIECPQGLDSCATIPLTFNNASPSAPGGLLAGVRYLALPAG